MTLVYLVRHASHGDLGRVLTGRRDGAGLTMGGQIEAARLAAWFRGRTVAAVHASPRQRAIETAEAIAEGSGRAVTVAEDLDEIDYAGWSGRRFEDLEADPDFRAWNEQRGHARVPGGESMGEAQARIATYLRSAAADAEDGGGLVMVSHADMIRAAVADVLGLDLDNLLRFEIAAASVTTVRYARDGAVILGMNERIVDTTDSVAPSFRTFDPRTVTSA